MAPSRSPLNRQSIAQAMTDREFEQIIAGTWAAPAEPSTSSRGAKRSQTIADDRRAALLDLWRHSPTNEQIRGTRWAAYQAVTEYVDHVAPVADRLDPAAARAERAITSATAERVKVRAFDLLRSA